MLTFSQRFLSKQYSMWKKISPSAVELGFLDDFWVPGTYFSPTVSQVAVVYVRRRFQRLAQKRLLRMIFGHRFSVLLNGFLSKQYFMWKKISASAVELSFLDDFWVPGT